MTSIQKFLGHKKLNTTMTYARAHDKTVEADYYAAMSRIEQRLELAGKPDEPAEPASESQREQLLTLTEQLAEPELSFELRLEIVFQIRGLINGQATAQEDRLEDVAGRSEWIPPPSPALLGAESLE